MWILPEFLKIVLSSQIVAYSPVCLHCTPAWRQAHSEAAQKQVPWEGREALEACWGDVGPGRGAGRVSPSGKQRGCDLPGGSVNVKVAQSCLTLCNPMNCSPPSSSVHGILQARRLEWAAIPFFSTSSQFRDWTRVSCIAGRFFTVWATKKLPSPLQDLISQTLSSPLPGLAPSGAPFLGLPARPSRNQAPCLPAAAVLCLLHPNAPLREPPSENCLMWGLGHLQRYALNLTWAFRAAPYPFFDHCLLSSPQWPLETFRCLL